MSLTAFQAAVTLNSATETFTGSGIWTIDFNMIDYEGIHLGSSITIGDVIVLDTSAQEFGTMSHYTIDSIVSKDAFGAVVVASFDLANGGNSPDLFNYDTAIPGLITRRTPSLSLLNIPSIQIQQLPDKFAFYLINFMNAEIVDPINATPTKPDWNAPLGNAAEILNKPTLGTAAAHDVAVTGDATSTQVVLGNDTRLIHPIQVLTNALPTPSTLGGIAAGTTFDNIPVETILQNLLYPYQVPTFSSFSMSGQSTPIEVGTVIATGSHTFTWTTTNSVNISANTISISDVTNALPLATNTVNDGTEIITLSSITKSSALSHTWRVAATNTQSTTFQRDYTVSWQWRRFYGESVSTSLIASDVQALRVSGLATAFAGVYVFNAGGYKYIAYPAVFGTATSFKDQSTNIDVPFQTVQVISITNTNGIATNYNIHRTTNVIGSSMNIIVA